MKVCVIAAAGVCALLSSFAAASASPVASPASPYAGQQAREIKALSSDDVDSYLAGRGMGFAKAAELNGYPGPAHVLELAPQLGLTPKQRRRTESLFASMQARAIKLGRSLVDEERKLDQLFASKTITSGSLGGSSARIGALQAKLRAVHLDAHLAQVRILTPAQVARYAQLRGYTVSRDAPAHAPHRHSDGRNAVK